jgi:hypothetical protein
VSCFQISRVAVNDQDWTRVKAPIRCNYWSIRCDAAPLKIRTDPDDPATEDSIPVGSQESLTSGCMIVESMRHFRYEQGDTLCFLQAALGEQSVILRVLY